MAVAALAVWLGVSVPLAVGARTLFFRDVFSNHFALKAFGARELAEGRVPALNPSWGLGQPFRGNPSALAFYPDNLLYLALPFWSAYNLHFALHWLLAALTFFALARELGQGRPAALLAALTWAGSGWLLSCLSFYNLITVAAWWPLAMWGVVRGGRRGVAVGGLACGLAVLGGEPMTAALGLLPLAVAALAGRRGEPWRRHGLRALGKVVAIGALGAAVALPQLIATFRISGFTFRGAHGMIASQAVTYTLHPLRYLELLVPFPFGRPLDFGATGFWAGGVAPKVPFYLTLYCGVVALLLAAGAVRRRPAWAALAAAGLGGAWLAGLSGELLVALTRGLFRFPEKLLLWPALALPLLAGWGLERALERPRPRVRAAWIGAGAAAALAAALALLRPAFVRHAESFGLPSLGADRGELVAAQTGLWLAALALAAVLLAAAGWALARLPPRRAAAALAALQLAALLQLWPLVRTDSTAPYRRPSPWAARALAEGGERAAVFSSHIILPAWHPSPRYRLPTGSKAQVERLQALDLSAAPGVLWGLTYPLYPDLEGLSSPLYSFLILNLARMDWPERVRWMRAVGVDVAVVLEEPGVGGLRRLDETVRAGVPTRLVAVEGGAPEVWWPERVEPVPSPLAALTRVAELDNPVATVVISREVEHRTGGTARLLAASPDAITVAVDGPGGVLAVRRSYQHLWRARASGAELDVFPLNLTLVGVEVPPGRRTVELTVSSWPETLAAAGGTAAALLCLALAWWPGRRRAGDEAVEGGAERGPAAGEEAGDGRGDG